MPVSGSVGGALRERAGPHRPSTLRFPRLEVKIKADVSIAISVAALQEALEEFDEIAIADMLKEVLDKAIAVDEVKVEVVEGPKTLDEYDEQEQVND